MNSSQIVQLQAQAQQTQQIQQVVQVSPPVVAAEGTKVDWEQELDDANRKGGKTISKSNGASGPAAKKLRLDETEGEVTEVAVMEESESVDIVDPVANLLVFGEQN